MIHCLLTLLLGVIVVFNDDVTANENCMSHALTLAGIGQANAMIYSSNMARLSASFNDLRFTTNLTFRALGVSSLEDRQRISQCFGSGTCPLRDICSRRGVCQIRTTASSHSGYYACECQSGYSGDQCENIQDNCLSNPCQHGGMCLNSFKTFTCDCGVGYTGQRCQEKWLTLNGTLLRNEKLTHTVTDAVHSSQKRQSIFIQEHSDEILAEIHDLASSIADLQAAASRQAAPKYRAFREKLSQANASYHCNTLGGELPTVTSALENEAVFRVAQRFGLPFSWISGSDQDTEGHWIFPDGNSLSYLNWWTGQPRASLGRVENCLMLYVTQGGAAQARFWHDFPCDYEGPFICQF